MASLPYFLSHMQIGRSFRFCRLLCESMQKGYQFVNGVIWSTLFTTRSTCYMSNSFLIVTTFTAPGEKEGETMKKKHENVWVKSFSRKCSMIIRYKMICKIKKRIAYSNPLFCILFQFVFFLCNWFRKCNMNCNSVDESIVGMCLQ